MVHWSPFVMSFKKKYPWIQLAGHAGSCCSPGLSDGMSSSRGAGVGRGPACVEGAPGPGCSRGCPPRNSVVFSHNHS